MMLESDPRDELAAARDFAREKLAEYKGCPVEKITDDYLDEIFADEADYEDFCREQQYDRTAPTTKANQ